MKRTMTFAELGVIEDSKKHLSVTIEVREPATVRQALVQARKPVIAPLIQGVDPKSVLELHPIIVFEVDPDGELKNHTFIVVPPGVTIDSEDTLEYRGTFLYPQGNLFFLFEEIKTP